MRFYRNIINSLVLFLLSTPAFSEEMLTQEAVEKYKNKCWPSQDYKVDLKFAPIRELPKDRVVDGQWGSEYVSDDERYPNNKIKLPAIGARKIDSVLILSKSDSDKKESYLWHVIAAPTVVGWPFGGHWPFGKVKNITDFSRLADKKSSLADVASLSIYKGDPVYTDIDISLVDESEDLRKAWGEIFSTEIVSILYDANKGASKGRKGYSLTFFYVPTPTLSLINDNGFRWPILKHVDRSGFAYSFVLTPEDDCIASNSIEIIK